MSATCYICICFFFFALSLKCNLQEETSIVLLTAVFLVLIIGSETYQTINQYVNKEGKSQIEKGEKDGKEGGERRERGVDSCLQPRVT